MLRNKTMWKFVPLDVSLIVLHFRDSEYGIPASPSKADGKICSLRRLLLLCVLFSETFTARLLAIAPLSFDKRYEVVYNMMLTVYHVTRGKSIEFPNFQINNFLTIGRRINSASARSCIRRNSGNKGRNACFPRGSAPFHPRQDS